MIVTDAGRDAVDAAVSGAQRGCRAGWRKARERSNGERTRDVAAYGEVVVLTPRCWRQVRGVKSAQPGLDKNISAGRRWQKSPVTGESTKETVKTIACGNVG